MRIVNTFLMLSYLFGAGATATASILSVSPTKLFITPDSGATAFKLTNGGDEKALVEVKIFAWTDSDDGNALEPTEDFLIAPPIFEVSPETTQVLRLVPRIQGELDGERMYRMIITEVPSEVGPANGVGFAVEMSLPVFMTPEGANADPVWSLRWKDVATPELALANQGEAHVRVRSFKLFSDSDDEPLFASTAAAYVLAGEETSWAIEADLAGVKGPLTLKAETTRGPIETLISLPGG